MGINPEYRTLIGAAADRFLKENPSCKCSKDGLLRFAEMCQDEHFNSSVYFDKYPTKSGKSDLVILVPRPMRHLFRGWKVRVMRLMENHDE